MRCACNGLLEVIECFAYRTVYRYRRCKKRWELKEVKGESK